MFKPKLPNLFSKENRIEMVFFFVITLIGGFLAIKYPYFWSDEAKCVDVFTTNSFYNFLIPGYFDQDCGGTNLFMALATIIWPIGNPYLILFTQWIILIFIFREIILIFQNSKFNRSQKILFLVIFSLHPLTLYYISEARQYYLDILISLYLLRRYLDNSINLLNPVMSFFLFWLSFTSLFTYVALQITALFHREKIRMRNLFLSILGAGTYTFSFRYFSARQYEKMSREFQHYTGANDFSFNNLVIKFETLFNLAMFYKGHLIALSFIALFSICALRKIKMTHFYFILSGTFFIACLLGIYPYFDYHMWTTIYTPRTIICMIPIQIFVFVIVLDDLTTLSFIKKYKKTIFRVLIAASLCLGIYRVPYVDFQHDRLSQLRLLVSGIEFDSKQIVCTRHDGIASKLRVNHQLNTIFHRRAEPFKNIPCNFFIIMLDERNEFESWVDEYDIKSIRKHNKFEILKRL